jgi:hypothetical protein
MKDVTYINNTIYYNYYNNNKTFIIEPAPLTNLRSDSHYTNNINKICPDELINNFAGKKGLYFNTTNQKIKKSILKRYFHHCGAWCLFDYTDPRKGWYWNSTVFDWIYQNELYLLCPAKEFFYAVNKFFNEN